MGPKSMKIRVASRVNNGRDVSLASYTFCIETLLFENKRCRDESRLIPTTLVIEAHCYVSDIPRSII